MSAEGSEAVTISQLKMWGDEKLTGGGWLDSRPRLPGGRHLPEHV